MSLDARYDDANIFAKIIRGELPCVKLHEDDRVLSFLDIFPQVEGHALVIPKAARATNLFDLPPDDLAALSIGVQRVAMAVKSALKPDGVRIAQFNGAPAGQTVFHVHFHILPVFAGQGERAHGSGVKADPSALEALAEKIRKAF